MAQRRIAPCPRRSIARAHCGLTTEKLSASVPETAPARA